MGRSSIALDTLEPGYVLCGKYLVERRIGEGGMGVVYRAIHLDLAHPVAIKLVREGLAQQEELARRMLLEARAAANIRSEHVARVLDVGRTASGAPYIVMEYLEGKDLCDVLAQHGRLEHTTAIDFILQACEAVAEAHTHGIVHRDLKPENLFLTTRADGAPVIKVLDFGIAKKLRPNGRAKITNPTTAVGSPHYMAPEQMRARDPVDHRADIWSLGAILYELIGGSPPFHGDTIPSVCVMALAEDPRPLSELAPEVPDAIEKIVLRCLEKRPERRFSNVAELAAALGPFGSRASSDYAERVSRVISGVRTRSPWTSAAGSRRRHRHRSRKPAGAPPSDRSQLSFAKPVRKRPRPSWSRAPVLVAAAGCAVFAAAALTAVPRDWLWRNGAPAPSSQVIEHKVTGMDLPVNVEGSDFGYGLGASELNATAGSAGALPDAEPKLSASPPGMSVRAPGPLAPTAEPRTGREGSKPWSAAPRSAVEPESTRERQCDEEASTDRDPLALDRPAAAAAAPTAAAMPQGLRTVNMGGAR